MAIIQCQAGHFFDSLRFAECPFCKARESDTSENFSLTQLNIPLADDFRVFNGGSSETKTVGYFDEVFNTRPVTGWLVAVSGQMKGKSYEIFPGRNFAGTYDDMDIPLTYDRKICGENHFSIIYDPKSISFYAVAGAGGIFVNSKPVIRQQKLKQGDVLQAGDTEMIFIPFCRKGRAWKCEED